MEDNAYPPIEPVIYQEPLRPHRGGTVLALGILGLLVCFICGIIAWVMGNSDLREMDAGIMDPSGRSITQAGKICGMVSVLIPVLVFCIWMMILLVVGIAAATSQ